MATIDILIAGGRIFFNDGGNDGAAGNGLLDLGNLPALTIQKSTTDIEHFGFNAITRARSKDLNIVTDIAFTLSFTVDELFAEMWNILLFGGGTTPQVESGGSEADEPHTAPLLLDRSIFTLKRNISSVVITDTVPNTPFILGTDYTIENAETGEIKIIDGGAITSTMDLLVDYTAAAETRQKIVPGADPSVKGSARLEVTAQNGDDLTWIIQNCEVKPDGDSPVSSTEASEVSVVLNILTDKVVTPAEPFGSVTQG
jgi:hypothetical protein